MALWQGWAVMESKQGEPRIVAYLFRRGLEIAPRSRYLFLAWALWEKQQGRGLNARRLLAYGHSLNPRDAALLQVSG